MECRVNVAGGTPIRSCVKGKLQCFLMHNTYLLSLCSGSCPARNVKEESARSLWVKICREKLCAICDIFFHTNLQVLAWIILYRFLALAQCICAQYVICWGCRPAASAGDFIQRKYVLSWGQGWVELLIFWKQRVGSCYENICNGAGWLWSAGWTLQLVIALVSRVSCNGFLLQKL